jgi:general nucleoside transport system permease protein
MTINGVNLEDLLTVLLGTGLIAAVPLTLAALGECFVEQAGLLNLGLEGMMLVGAFFGYWAAERSDSILLGLLVGMGVGLLLGAFFAILAVSLRVDQVLIGLAITIFGGGLTGFLFRDIYRQERSLDVRSPRLGVPLLSDIPVIGPALFDQQVLVYLTWASVPLLSWLLLRTRFGLEVRAVGENPFAADASGVDVVRVRYLAMLLGGALGGLAGAFLSVAELRFFNVGMTVGTGFIAIAIAMLGRWRPWRILIGAVAFGLLRSLETGLPIVGVDVRTEFLQMIPYLGIILALVVLAGRTALPAALAVPYERGHR